MISDSVLNEYRLEATQIRVVRDADEINDVKGTIIAWDNDTLLIRRKNRRVVKLPRKYLIQPLSEPRTFEAPE
jgi:hypothetical protein